MQRGGRDRHHVRGRRHGERFEQALDERLPTLGVLYQLDVDALPFGRGRDDLLVRIAKAHPLRQRVPDFLAARGQRARNTDHPGFHLDSLLRPGFKPRG
jgi:hypothetical protein